MLHAERLLPVVFLLAACAGEPEVEEPAAMDTEPVAAEETAAAAPAAGAPSDAEIAAIAVEANEQDIETAELALERSENEQVREFAQRMVTDHTAVNQQATELVTRLGVTPQPNETSQSLEQGGDQARTDLSQLQGAEFDQAYIDHEVQYHQQVLDALDQVLIPNAQNAELRALLEQVRPAIEAHLQQAQQIQSSLQGA